MRSNTICSLLLLATLLSAPALAGDTPDGSADGAADEVLAAATHESAAAPESADQTLGMALMVARVLGNGTLAGGAGAVSAVRNSTGSYNVTFNRSVTDCHHVVSVSANSTSTYFGIAVSSKPSSGPDVLHVRTFWPTAEASDSYDRPFTLLVFCTK